MQHIISRVRKTFISLLAVFIMIMTMATSASAHSIYDDVPENHEFHVAIDWANTTGVARGVSPRMFKPEASVSRTEFATMLGRAMEVTPLYNTDCFNDLNGYNPEMKGFVCRLASLNIIRGYGDGRFGPNDNVTQAQAIVLITRAMVFLNIWELETTDDPSVFPNVQFSRLEVVTYAHKNGGMYGYNSPNVAMTSANIATTRGLAVNLIMNSFWDFSQGYYHGRAVNLIMYIFWGLSPGYGS